MLVPRDEIGSVAHTVVYLFRRLPTLERIISVVHKKILKIGSNSRVFIPAKLTRRLLPTLERILSVVQEKVLKIGSHRRIFIPAK